MEGSNNGETKPKRILTTRRVVHSRKIARVTNGNTTATTEQALSLPPIATSIAKCIFLDIPLAILFFAVLGVGAFYYWNVVVLFPQMQRYKWTPERAEAELIYYDMSCQAESIVTATNRTPLLLSANQSIPERVDSVRLHGAGIFSNLFDAVDDGHGPAAGQYFFAKHVFFCSDGGKIGHGPSKNNNGPRSRKRNAQPPDRWICNPGEPTM